MHHLRLKAAVEKYASVSAEELTAALQADDKNYTAEEIQEITAALSKPTPPVETPKVEDNPFGKKHYQEWRVEMVGGKPSKLKIMRERVMITDEQAATLNEGVEEGKLNQYAVMYYPA